VIGGNKKSLVLVLGAGASKEVHLPLGAELTKEIANALALRDDERGDGHVAHLRIRQALSQLVQVPQGQPEDMNTLMQACHAINKAMPLSRSIDNFIDCHRANRQIALCGKLAIASCILEAESRSTLMVDRSNIYNTIQFDGLEKSWFTAFFNLLTDQCDKNEVEANFRKVSIISFNYDRCIEHFLHSALQRLYGESAEWATKVMKALDIYHPYGKVGALPLMEPSGTIEYGAIPNGAQLLNLSRQLLTFTEGTDARKSDIECIRRDIAEAERIAFLGFAFHPLNLDLLFDGRPGINVHHSRAIYATAYGISEANAEAISLEIASRSKRGRDRYLIRRDIVCAGLFHEFGRGLAL
jgi:hypothetical protein